MKILQSRQFERKVKKFTKQEKKSLDKQILKIADNPAIGSEKKGDLRGVYVHKFKIKYTQYLLYYRFAEENLELIMIGPHENYYRDLKSYLKSRSKGEQYAHLTFSRRFLPAGRRSIWEKAGDFCVLRHKTTVGKCILLPNSP